MLVTLLQLCPTLQPHGHSPPGSPVHGILQARTLEWIVDLPAGDPPDPGIEPRSLASPALAGRFFTSSATREAQKPRQVNIKVDGCKD